MKERRPKPGVAALLALISPGLGHLYVGHRPWFVGALIALPVYILAAFSALAFLPGLAGLGLVGVLIVGWLLFWPLHAKKLASSTGSGSLARSAGKAWQLLVAALLTYGWLQVIGAALPFRTFVATSGNMEPTLLPGDHFIVLPNRRDGPRREDVALYRAPDLDGPIIGRIVALEGDTIEMHGGVFFRNGEAETASYVYRSREQSEFELTDWGPVTVPPGTVFVLGDHRNASIDSRERGPISVDQVFGRVVRIHFSRSPYRLFPRWGRIGNRLS